MLKQPKNNPYIKQIDADDFPACMALFGRQCPFSKTCFEQREAGNREAYAMYLKGKIIAECHLVYENPEYGTIPGKRAYFSRMVTKKAFRRQGYGTKMAQFILALAKEKGYEEIALGVDCNNDAALHLYQNLGFTVYESAEDAYGKYYRMEKNL